MVSPSTKWLPISRIACRVAARTAGTPNRFARRPIVPSGVSPGWITRADIPSAHADALTRNALDFVSWCTKSPWPSLSSMNWSAVRASGTRSKASASTISARPSLVESANSRSMSSTPPSRSSLALIASIRRVAVRSIRASCAASKPAVSALYSTVSIFPPSAKSMTVCYGFVCRRREVLDFTPGDRNALTQILAAGRASAAAERAAVQKAVVWFDRRMGPVIGTDKRVAKADFRYFDDKHNYDCWDTTRNTTSLLLVLQQWGLLRHHVVGDPHYRGNALVLQTPHNTAVQVGRATKGERGVGMWPRGVSPPP